MACSVRVRFARQYLLPLLRCWCRRGRDGDVAAPKIQAKGVGGGAGQDLQGGGPCEFVVAGGLAVEDLVAAEVEDDEAVVGDEAEAVGPGLEGFGADGERHFGDEVGLVGLLKRRGVAGGV